MPIISLTHEQSLAVANGSLYVKSNFTVPTDLDINPLIGLGITIDPTSPTRSEFLVLETSDLLAYARGDDTYLGEDYTDLENAGKPVGLLVGNLQSTTYVIIHTDGHLMIQSHNTTSPASIGIYTYKEVDLFTEMMAAYAAKITDGTLPTPSRDRPTYLAMYSDDD